MSQEVQGMLIRLEATTAQLRQEMARADSTVAQVSGRMDRQLATVDAAFNRTGLSALSAGNMVRNALALAVGGTGISALLQHAEAYTTIANRMKLVTSSAAEFTAAQNAVFSIAQRAGQPLGATAELYQRIAQNQDTLKLSGQGVANIVETISKTMVISGASAQASEAALVQLGQAFASGTLRGEELNSVMEQAPALSQAIAKGMGVSVGALRALGAEGTLTAQSVVSALQAQQQAVDALFGKMQNTISVGVTQINNSVTSLVGKLDTISSSTAKVSAVLTNVSASMDSLTKDSAATETTFLRISNVVETLAYLVGGRLALAAGQAVVGFVAATKASIEQTVALAGTTAATLQNTAAAAASARQSLLTAQSRQADASALLARANAEVVSAEQKVSTDRVRQQSEINNLKSVQAVLVSERVLEEQRLGAQISEQGRALARNRMAEARLAEIAIIKQIQAAEAGLVTTTIASSAQIQAAYAGRSAAAAAYGETTLAVNAAVRASDAATAAASNMSKAMLLTAAAGRGVLGLLTGPVGLIAMTGAVAYSFLNVGESTGRATQSLIAHNETVEESISRYQVLSAEQQRLQKIVWAEQQIKAIEAASSALDDYAYKVERGITLGKFKAEFRGMIEDVEAGRKSLDSVTAWIEKNTKLTPEFSKELAVLAGNYRQSTESAGEFQKKLNGLDSVNKSTTASTEKLKAAQASGGQTEAATAAWDKYVEQLTKTRDLLGANAAAEAAYTAAKMGATPAQAAQAKVIADQTDTLKKYQEAIKEGDKVQQASLKLQLVALYTAEDAAIQAAKTQSQAYADTATAAEHSTLRQITAIERAANFAVAAATRVAMGAAAPSVSGYGLLTNGGVAPVAPVAPIVAKATPLDRASAAIAQLDATTEANKRTDKAANSAAKAIENQKKALDNLLATSAISTKAANDIADAYLSGANTVRELTIHQEIEQALLKTGAGAYEKVTAAVNALHDAKDREDVSKTIANMRLEIDNTLAQATATLKGTAALEAFNVEKAVQAELIGKNIAVGSQEYQQLLAITQAQREANKALEQANAIDGIVDRLSPQLKLLKDYTQEQDALNAVIASGVGDTALYQDTLRKLGLEYELNRSKATLWGQMTEGAIDRIDEAFANAWGNIGDGAQTLWDNLKKGFKQTLGEIAHMLTSKPLLASFSNWLTGTDNGQGLSSVWGKLLGGGGGSSGSSGGSGGFGDLLSLGKNLYSAWSNLTGVGSSMASGYASGGISGALSSGAGYYGTMLSNIASTLSGGFASLVGGNIAITGATAAGTAATTAALTGITVGQAAATAATVGAQGITTAALSGAVAEGAASIGANIGLAGASTSAATSGLGASISSAMSSAAAMWPLAVVMGMYQSGKLYDAGVRPDAGEMWDSAGNTGLGKAALLPQTLGAKYFEVADGLMGKVVGGKMAAILSGSTLFQAVWSKVGNKLFGSGYQTKDTGIQLDVSGGVFDAQQYTQQKKKGGWLSGSSKTRYLNNALDTETEDALGSAYNEKILNSMGLFSALGVQLSDSVFDGLNMAVTRISTQGKTGEAIQAELDTWFGKLGDSAVRAISDATGADTAGFTFDTLTAFVNGLYSVNDSLGMLSFKLYDISVNSGFMAEQLVAMAGGLEAFNTANSSFFEHFYTDVEKADYTLSTVQKQFEALNITLPKSRDGYREMVKALDLTTESGRQMYATLIGLAGSAAASYDILEQRATASSEAMARANETALAALNTAVNDAMSAVQRAVSAEKNAATEAYNAQTASLNDMLETAQASSTGLKSISSALSAALKSLTGRGDDAVKMLRNQAKATVQSALAIARAGGSLSGFSGLEDALGVISDNDTALYGSLEDFNREQGRNANLAAELNLITEQQLSADEALLRTVKEQIKVAKQQYDDEMLRLDNQLLLAQQQIDALHGVDNSVLSVVTAMGKLSAAIAEMAEANAKPAVGTPGSSGGASLDSLYNELLGRDPDQAGKDYWNNWLNNGGTLGGLSDAIKNDALANGELKKYATGGLVYGPGTGTSDDVLARLSNGEYVMSASAVRMFGPDLLDQMNAGQLPAFAAGGPVLEVTRPSQIYSAQPPSLRQGGQGDHRELIAEVRQLREDNQQAQFQIAKNTQQLGVLLRKWDTEGAPKERDYT